MENKDRLKEIIDILKESNIIRDHSPKNVRMTIEKLGSTFIKLGQILSTRADFLPMEYCDELSKLRSEVTPLPYEEIEKILKKTYKNYDAIFKKVNVKPVGAASIAQVHKAKLKTGENVVIKIKRPGIDEQLKTDIDLMKEAIKVLHINDFVKVMDLTHALDEIYEITKEELDFTKEASHIEEFLDNNEDNEYVTAPKVFDEYTTPNTIVMEEIKGIKINDISSLKEDYDLSAIATILSDNYIKQALDDGMFHADPHSDNIMVYEDKIVFIDWGMVGRLKTKNRDLLKECMKDIIIEDYENVASILMQMSTSKGEVSLLNLTNDVKTILTSVGDTKIDEINIKEFITNMFKMLQSNNLILDYDVTSLVRGITIIEGVLEKLDPSISLVKVLKRHVLETEINEISTQEIIEKAGKKLYQGNKSLLNLPSDVDELIRLIKSGDFKFKFELSDSSKQIDKIESLVHELILGFIDGCLIISFTYIEEAKYKTLILVLIGIISLLLLIKMLKDSRHSGY